MRALLVTLLMALGTAFDIKACHDQSMGSGQLPMAILEQRIDDWIATVKG